MMGITMARMLQLFFAEARKLRRSPALRTMWLFPVIFILVDLLVSGLPVMMARQLSLPSQQGLPSVPVMALADTWSGYFHPLLIALLPPLLYRSEHRFGLWKHLHVQPVSRKGIFAAKALLLGLGFALVLGTVLILLRLEWVLIAVVNPMAHVTFPWGTLLRVLAWSYLGSLPLLSLYLWLSDRINNAAVPIMFALVGLLLTVSLGGKELDRMWRRDFIPWVLPYTCAQQAIEDPSARQEVHSAQKPYYIEQKVESPKDKRGRKLRIIYSSDPNFGKPPPPTPPWALATFSLGCAALLFLVGLVEAGRDRA